MSELRKALEAALGPVYRVEREVRPNGACRMFVVTGEPVAPELLVKLLPLELSVAVDAVRFEREILLLARRIDHPHLVAPHGAGAAGPLVYHSRPFLNGTTLRAHLQRHGELPVHLAVQILRDVLGALARAHANGITHGDLRPENVLLTDSGALLADTGVAAATAASIQRNHPVALALELCDPRYRAPELRTGLAQWDERTDVFAVGAMAYEMLAGKPPVKEPDPLGGRRAIPPALGQLLMRCLADRPGDRPEGAAGFQAEIEVILH